MRLQIRQEYCAVFGEEPNRYLIDSIRDKKGSQNVYRVVQMAQEYDYRKEYWPGKKDVAQGFLIPEDKREKKGGTSVAGEKEICSTEHFCK